MKLKRISEHFYLRDLVQSKTAERLICIEQYRPSTEVQRNLEALARNILDKIKDEFPGVVITSCYRCHALNDAVMGARNSQHIKGQAADLYLFDHEPLVQFCRKLDYDQLIDYGHYLHISYRLGYRRKQFVSLVAPED